MGARDDVSPFGLPRLWLRTRPVARTARGAPVRTGAFESVLPTGPTRAVPSIGLHRHASAEWAAANGAFWYAVAYGTTWATCRLRL